MYTHTPKQVGEYPLHITPNPNISRHPLGFLQSGQVYPCLQLYDALAPNPVPSSVYTTPFLGSLSAPQSSATEILNMRIEVNS